MMKQELLMEVKYDERGLVPVVTQDALTGSVLMQAYMSRESLALTLEKGGRWLDTANLLKNSQGSLNAIYDSGDGLHFNKRAYQVLFNYYDQHRIY